MNRIVVTKLEHHQTEYLAYLVLDENRKLQELQVFEPDLYLKIFLSDDVPVL